MLGSPDEAPERAAEVLERITDGFVALDLDWRITYVNGAAERMIGRAREELVGRLLWDEYPTMRGTAFERAYRRALDEQVVVTLERRFASRPDRWVAVHVYPSANGLSIYLQEVTERKRAEEALAASEARYRLIAETAHEGIWLADAAFRTLWMNGQLADLLGATPEQLGGRPVSDFVYEDDLPALSRRMAECRRGVATQYEIRMRRIDGRVIWVLARIAAVVGPDGAFQGALGMLTDITERKRMEDDVRAQREWLRVTLSSIGDAVIATDRDGRITFLNAIAENMTGWSGDEAVGRPLDEVFRIYDEQTREPVESPVTRVLREDRVVELANHTTLIARDGSERTIDDSGAPIREAGGAIVGVVLVFRDNTERARRDRALRLSEERFRSLCDCSPVGIFIADVAGRCTYTNASCQQICGFTADEALGDGWLRRVHPDDREWLGHEWAEGRRVGAEFRFQHASGAVRWARVRTSPMLGDDGRPLGTVGTVEDVTERRAALDVLREADRRKDEFLAMLAHELRNPLAPIRSALEVLRFRPAERPQVERVVGVLDRQVEHMTRLVDDLLDVSRITRGLITLRRARVDFGSVVARALETARPFVDQRGQSLEVTLPPTGVELDADGTRLAQVMSNLIHNASKFSPSGARIRVSARVAGDELALEVCDPGIGIDPELLPNVFEPFVQAEQALDRTQSGLGIGLTLVRRLVEMHGGRVTAHSDGPGRGSVFTVHLPATLRTAPLATGSERPVAGRAVTPRRILVVDDNVDAAGMLAELLRLFGHDARVVHEAELAVEAVRRDRPDLVLLDIGMPRMSGYDVARVLRGDASLVGLKLVALTGYGHEDDRRRSREAGFDRHLVKPVDLTTLRGVLDELLAAAS